MSGRLIAHREKQSKRRSYRKQGAENGNQECPPARFDPWEIPLTQCRTAPEPELTLPFLETPSATSSF